ncbi:MAG: AlpA family transcriptional regulator [Colwellia sp.]|jgi:Predicted transcriptional regulator
MRVLKLKAVIEKTTLCHSTIYKLISESSFPKPIDLTGRAVGWVDSEIDDWILAKITERDCV